MDRQIILKKVKVHNLKSVDLTLDPNELIVFTGLSGSGKSSLAFDTLFVEGQRRYVESLSAYARRQLGDMAKPELESATGISPTISIEQKTAGRNPRSTVGTMTGVYDYMRVLYARVGVPHCPVSGKPVKPQSRERIIKTVEAMPEGTKLILLAPYAKGKKGEFRDDFQELLRKGFMRLRVDGQILDLSDTITLDGSVAHDVDIVIDRVVVKTSEHSRIAESLTMALEVGEGVCLVWDVKKEEEQLFSMHAFSQESGLSYSSLDPHDFSFNSPLGMCNRCNGLGLVTEFDLAQVINPDKSISEDCCSIASSYQTVRYGNIYDNLANLYHFDVHTPWKHLPREAQEVLLHGTKKKWTRMRFVHPVTGSTWMDHVRWRGILHEAHTRFIEAKSERYRKKREKLMHQEVCPVCAGARLKAYPAATRLGGKRIAEVTQMTIQEAFEFFHGLSLDQTEALIAEELLKEIQERLRFLSEVGLHYLTLSRTAPTLSGGEAQRVRLASQIGCGLVGITYVLDEPSIGLHPRDNTRLIRTLEHLRDMGNTVIVVEHDEETIWAADRIVDFGPGPGEKGGKIVVNGDHKALLECTTSLTADYLSGKKTLPIPKKRRKPKRPKLEIVQATHHNLKGISVKIPLGLFVAVTGVSGSGKSSLITDILYPALANTLHHAEHPVGSHKALKGIKHLDKVIAIDQSPIGRNPRSNPSTYIKLSDDIRNLFSQLPESCARGYQPGRFSFNVKEGSCTQCHGMGQIQINMDFMEDAWVLCPHCKGRRFDHETLSVLYKGRNIYDVLEMTVSEALEFFTNLPKIKRKLETLEKVGMGYIKLGQSSTTLSGGEAQRVKLAKELVRPATGRTLYILDEPTTGLHFHDIGHLLKVLHTLVEQGNTVLVIEHNMDVVKTADWIIDLGPEGGAGGGAIVATDSPETIAKMSTPTGEALSTALHANKEERVKLALDRAQKKRKKETKEQIVSITVGNAEQNNLKHLNLTLPRQKLTVCTGPSGSGKSSLAFETIYAEGQRRYIESLSPYARQFVKQMPKPKVGFVEGLSPAIAIEQKAHAGNPRSTIGTMTEIYDYLRILYARVGVPHCPETGEVIKAISKDHVVERVLTYPEGEKIQVLAPLPLKKGETFETLISRLKRLGYIRIRLDGTLYDLDAEKIPYNPKRKHALFLVVDRLKINPSIINRLFEAIENAAEIGSNHVTIAREKRDVSFNLAFAVEKTGKSYPEITPHTFSFNTAEGMCLNCQGLGYQYGANLSDHADVAKLHVAHLLKFLCGDKLSWPTYQMVQALFEQEGVDPLVTVDSLPTKKRDWLMNGSPKTYPTPHGYSIQWVGINNVLAKAGRSGKTTLRQGVIPFLDEHTCPACAGSRLNPLARNVTIQDLSIDNLCQMPLDKALTFLTKVPLPKGEEKFLQEVKTQIINRLNFLCEVGLHYLALERKAPTLSGGETQRIRLARQLGSGLTGVLYVLDEPTIGLHPRDNARLNAALKQLLQLGNTMLMVEHDPLTIQTADYILDFGPLAGNQGGYVTAQGSLKQIMRNPNSLTGKYLSGTTPLPLPKKRRPLSKQKLTLQNAHTHNLKNLSVTIPLGIFTCLTGVSGSGKSTLVHDVLLPALEKGIHRQNQVTLNGATTKGIKQIDRVIAIDQNPIGHTIRSDVATYTDLFSRMRTFFASLPEAKARGLQPKHFSYNHRAGMCSHCWGLGIKRIELHFLPPARIVCPECQGLRLNPLALQIPYKGKNLGQYLDSTIDEARKIFENHPHIKKILQTLIDVGLGYLKLGQHMVTLSGGEAQRIKVARELAKRSQGHTLYMLDEPTTGLHPEDIKILLKVLHRLVDKGNTLLIIEHNLDMIANADWVIDLGPEAGAYGGELVCVGTPEQVTQHSTSWTGKYLKETFAGEITYGR